MPEEKKPVNSTFDDCYIQTFVGGTFELKSITTVGELRRGLREWIDEISGWGSDDVPITECAMTQSGLHVTLKDGIVQ